jgi:hypothetical protein
MTLAISWFALQSEAMQISSAICGALGQIRTVRRTEGQRLLIDACRISSFVRHSIEEPLPSTPFSSFIALLTLLKYLWRGALWKPDGRKQMDYLRKAFYECEPDVTLEWLKLLVKHKAATEETIRELLGAARLREHLVGKR